jgi:phage gp36-like protein
MDNRTSEEVENRYNNAIKWLRDISMNKASLGEQDTSVASTHGRVVARTGVSNTDWDAY